MKCWERGLIVLAGMLLLMSTPCDAADVPGDSAAAHQHLDQILHRPMYRQWQLRQDGQLPQFELDASSRISRWLHGISRSFRDLIEWLFRSRTRRPSGAGGGGAALGSVLKAAAWTALVIAVIVIAVLIIKVVGQSAGTAPTALVLSRRQVREALEAGDAMALGTTEWMDEARRLAAEQNFRAVYRAMYLALLSGLHTAGKIEHNRNRTNWIYVQQYRGPSDERVTFSELTDLFDHVWYGRQEAREGANLDQLRQKVTRLTGAGA